MISSRQSEIIERLLANIDSTSVLSVIEPAITRLSQLYASDQDADLAKQSIYNFLHFYILSSLQMIDDLDRAGHQHKISVLTDPCTQLASKYLNDACHALLEERGLEEQDSNDDESLKQFLTLLQCAYIFHRMVEELDDRIQHFIGVPLTHQNMMHANLIAHEVIGDNFANRLDRLIESTFKQSDITKAIIEAQLDQKQIKLFSQIGKALSGRAVVCFAAEHNLSMF